MTSPPQFTAAQILEAARRAEAEGKFDYAVQFYKHIIDHHGAQHEAYEARNSLYRLAQSRRTGPPLSDAGAHHHGGSAEPRTAGWGPSHVGYTGSAARPPDPFPPRSNLPQVVSQAREVEVAHEAEFAFKDRYRAGTAMATAVNWLGWLATGMGAALGVAGLAGTPAALATTAMFGLPAGLVYGLSAAAAGLGLVFVSQLALAVFDNANATRHLLAIERAKAEL